MTTEGAPSGCSHVISDGNWKIGVCKNSDTDWRLGGWVNNNGSKYIAGSGVLDLRSLEEDCGVVLKSSSNGGLERVTTITEVYLPDSLETIDGGTFNNDNTASSASITKVVLGSGIKTIGSSAFRNCTKLQTVNFPEGLQTIGYMAFAGCTSLVLQEGGFPESLTTLGEKAFQNCAKLVPGRLDLKNVDTVSGVAHFEGCSCVEEVFAPNVKTVSSYMFSKCGNLKTAVFHDDLSSIGEYAFNNGGNLVSFSPSVIPKLRSIGQEAFRGQKKLSVSFDFSKSQLTTVPKYALVDLHNVKEIRFPETLASLGSESIAYNNGARRVVRFAGPPPEMANGAMHPGSNSGRWVLVAGVKHAAEWKASGNLIALEDSDLAASDYPGLPAVKEALGLEGTVPVGKWKTGTNGATFWVVEELPQGTVLVVR